MKLGVLSDIHSNIYAFRACTAYLEQQSCDEYLFLGDYISDTPYARESLDFLYDFTSRHTCHLLRGNREEYMLAQQEAREKKLIRRNVDKELLQVETYSTLTSSLWIKTLIFSGICLLPSSMRNLAIRRSPAVTVLRQAAGNYWSWTKIR